MAVRCIWIYMCICICNCICISIFNRNTLGWWELGIPRVQPELTNAAVQQCFTDDDTHDPVQLDFKQHHFYFQIWKSRFSNLKIPIFKFEYPDFQIWISRRPDSPLRQWDIKIWKSGYSSLKIQIFKFEYPNIQIIVYFPIPSNIIQYDPMPS